MQTILDVLEMHWASEMALIRSFAIKSEIPDSSILHDRCREDNLGKEMSQSFFGSARNLFILFLINLRPFCNEFHVSGRLHASASHHNWS